MTTSRWPIPRGPVLAAMATIVLVMGLAMVSFITVDSFVNESRMVSVAHVNLTELKAAMSALEVAEDANRGFILTNQDDYLKEYEEALSRFSMHYNRLLETLAPVQRQALLDLKTIVDARLDRLRHGLALAMTNREQASAYIEAGEGKTMMDRIQAGEEKLEESQRNSIANRDKEFTTLAHLVKAVDFIAGMLAVIIVLASIWAIEWHWNKRIDAERSLMAANMRLEQDVEERTASLAEVNQRLQVQAADLARSNQELESFSYSISHDLRAPLRIIEGLAGTLIRKSGDQLDERRRSNIDLMIGNTRRMRDLIDDLLAFSKLGFKDVTNERVDMDRLVAECWASCHDVSAEKPVVFVVEPLSPCRGDPKLLRQVLINLFSNALKYSRNKPESRIRMASRPSKELIEYRVTDNGVGFDMSARNKLFGVFQRLHSDAEFEGTGIGLAICRRIVERHGGTIQAESVPDEATTFMFSIPAWTDGG